MTPRNCFLRFDSTAVQRKMKDLQVFH